MAKRRIFSNEMKSKVAVEAIKGIKTVNEIATEYEVHPNQVSAWKKHALDNLPDVMADGRTRNVKDVKNDTEDKLHSKIGQLTMEVDFLKKTLLRAGMYSE